MNQENVNKSVNEIKANRNYLIKQFRQSTLRGTVSEDDFNAALNIVNVPVVTLEYKGAGIRFFALITDAIIFGILFWLFIKIFPGIYISGCNSGFYIGSTITLNGNKIFYGLYGFPAQLYFLVIFVYHLLLEWKINGMLEKLIIGIRVIKATGKPLDLKASLIRNVMRIVDFLHLFYLVGVISIWDSKTKQMVGDKLAKTFMLFYR